MDPSNVLKSRLSDCLDGKIEFDQFHSIFVDYLQTSRKYERAAQDLIWSIEIAIANFGSGRWSAEELREELNRLAYSSSGQTWVYVQPVLQGEVEVTASNHLQQAAVVEYSRLQVEIAPALGS